MGDNWETLGQDARKPVGCTRRVETWPSDTKRLWLRRLAALEGRSMSALLRHALLFYIEAMRPADRRWRT